MSEAIGALIDQMHEIREQRRELAKEEERLGNEYKDLETRLIETLDNAGIESSKSTLATATISKTEVANVQDWDKFHAWLRKTNRLYMLERRPAQKAFREYLKDSRGHKPPPGVETFEKRTISLRNRPHGS